MSCHWGEYAIGLGWGLGLQVMHVLVSQAIDYIPGHGEHFSGYEVFI